MHRDGVEPIINAVLPRTGGMSQWLAVGVDGVGGWVGGIFL